MMNLEKCQAIYVGNISNLVHDDVVTQGSVLAVGDLSDKKGVYEAKVPATATLETDTFVLVFNDETIYHKFSNISDFVTMDAGTILRGYHMTVGEEFVIAESLLAGEPTVGQFLVPADGTTKLTPSATGMDVNFVVKVVEKTTIGYEKVDAWRVRVIAPMFTDAIA